MCRYGRVADPLIVVEYRTSLPIVDRRWVGLGVDGVRRVERPQRSLM